MARWVGAFVGTIDRRHSKGVASESGAASAAPGNEGLHLEFFLAEGRLILTPHLAPLTTAEADADEEEQVRAILEDKQHLLEQLKLYLLYDLTMYSALLETNSYHIAVNEHRVISRFLPALEREYPGIAFEVADTQGELIEKSVGHMKEALRDAVIMTVLVTFLFLADTRGTLLAAVSLPFTYLITFAFLWLAGFELNMVTLTGVIVGVGVLLDDAVVVLENIERHYHGLGEELGDAVVGGTQEVMLAILSGTCATVAVLVPIVWIGGYVQTVLRPLSLTLSIALLASYLVSVTVIPILTPFLLRLGGRTERWAGRNHSTGKSLDG